MIIYVSDWRKKAIVTGKILALLIAFGLVIPMIAMVNSHVPTLNQWIDNESTDQLMREERTEKTGFDKAVDQFVIKLQDFYYEERE